MDNKRNIELIQLIKLEYNNLSPSFQKVGKYIVTNFEEVAFSTAAKLSVEIGVSESVITRFAVKLGYKGFPEIQEIAKTYLRSVVNPSDKLEASNARNNLFNKVLTMDIENIKFTAENLTQSDFEEAVKIIRTSRRVYLAGSRASGGLSGILISLLSYIRKDVFLLFHEGALMYEYLKDISKDDCIIGLSFPRYTKKVVEALEYAKLTGVKTIAITDNVVSPIALIADITFSCKVENPSFFNSYASVIFFINLLVSHVAALDKGESLNEMKDLEEIMKNFNIKHRTRLNNKDNRF